MKGTTPSESNINAMEDVNTINKFKYHGGSTWVAFHEFSKTNLTTVFCDARGRGPKISPGERSTLSLFSIVQTFLGLMKTLTFFF